VLEIFRQDTSVMSVNTTLWNIFLLMLRLKSLQVALAIFLWWNSSIEKEFNPLYTQKIYFASLVLTESCGSPGCSSMGSNSLSPCNVNSFQLQNAVEGNFASQHITSSAVSLPQPPAIVFTPSTPRYGVASGKYLL